MKKNKVLLVEWEDTTSDGSWKARSTNKPNICICKTVGFVFEDTRKHLALYATDSNLDNISEQVCIPKKCIRKIRTLK